MTLVLFLFGLAIAGPSALFGWYLRGVAERLDRPLPSHEAARLAVGTDIPVWRG